MEIYQTSNYNEYYITKEGRLFKEIKLTENRDGYLYASLGSKENRKTERIHRIVADTFIPNEYSKPIVNHINGLKHDNSVENLEWVTAKENTQHAIKTGLFHRSKFQNLSKEQKDKLFEMFKDGERMKEISLEFNNITVSSIHYILEHDYGIKNIKDFRTNIRKRFSMLDRKRIKSIIFLSGATNRQLSIELGLSEKLIGKIKNGSEWSDIEFDIVKEFNYAPTTGRTNEELISIKSQIMTSNLSNSELAKILNLDKKTIYNIRNNKTWKLVPYTK